MINPNMRLYNYYKYGNPNEYGQAVLSSTPIGTVKMVIELTTQSTQDNINYTNAQYIGLTTDAAIDDTYVIEYENEKLKVLYVNHRGRLNQVFMERM